MNNIKARICALFGGNTAVAEICGVTPGAVSQWDDIPSKHQRRLLEAAPGKNVNLKPDDFFNLPTTKPKTKKSH